VDTRAGEPVRVATRSAAAWPGAGFAPDQRQLSVQVALPLALAGGAIGAIGLRFGTGDPALSADRRAAMLTVAGQCAQALDRARLRQAEREVAEVLQRSLLPRELPTLERLTTAARYLPGARGAQAGGDWYELMQIDDTRVALAVGDVVGYGGKAAAVMGQLRSALAGYLLDGHSPAAALERLDRFARRVDGALGSTCTCLTLDWSDGALCYASAGHLPTLLIEPDGPRFLDEAGGTVLGVVNRPPYREAGTYLTPGTSVLMYTDGLVERREESLPVGLERLAGAAADLGPLAPDPLLTRLLSRMLPGATQTDDVAVLAVRLLPEPAVPAPAPAPAPDGAHAGAPVGADGRAGPGRRRYALVGDVDIDTVAEARTRLLELADAPGELVIDLRGAGYFSSAGVGLLVEVADRARRHGARASVLVSPGSSAARVIAVTGLDDTLPVQQVEDD
jgi:anti-anti-sigma factor